MVPLLWIGLVGGSLGAGAALAVLLVVSRRREGLVMIAGVASMAGSVLSGNRLVTIYDRPSLTVIASLIAVGAVGGGFALVSSLLAYVEPRSRPSTLPPAGTPSRILVLLMVDIEAEEYVPAEVTREIAELVDAGLPEPTLSVTPFHYAAQKARYRAIGGRSPEPGQAHGLAERLEAHLDRTTFACPVVLRCGDGQSLSAALDAAHEAGFSAAVVTGAYIAESFHADAELRGAEARNADANGLAVTYTRSLWTSDELARLVARRALAFRSNPSQTGVALVVHGQPGEHGRINQSFDIQENAFANRVRLFLAEEGFTTDRVRVCAAEWRDPGVSETVRHLAALGCEHVLVVPVCHLFANLQTLLDIPAAARDARVAEDVRVVHVAPWGDDEVLAEVLAEAIAEAATDVAGHA
ncbi:MAG: ferrochelatase [Coriobacteriia bacterium]|nr:ferrochelatase [Coriobacteriia bacterium]